MDKYKQGVAPEFASQLNFPAIDPNKAWLIFILCLLGRVIWFFTRAYQGIKVTKHKVPCESGAVPVEYYENTTVSGKRPCIVFYHGGGFVLPAFGHHKKLLCEYALGSSADALFVDYTLAPKAKSDQVLGECYSSIAWLLDKADELNVDVNKVVLAGDSAGGCLAASMAQMVFDKMPEFKPCLQMLIYPVLDDAVNSESIKEHWDAPVWSGEGTTKMWPVYLSKNKEYAVPALRENLQGLAPAYIDNAEFDPLRDDAANYAKKLKAQGVVVEFHATKGTLHGYDAGLKGAITETMVAKRIAALKAVFN